MAGSIHKYQTTKGETRYLVMLEVGENGKRKQKKKMGFKTKKEANAFLVEAQNDINKGTYIEPSKLTFKDFIEDWFHNIKKKSLRRAAENYQIYLEKYILVFFEDNVPLGRLNGTNIQKFINVMHDKGYSPSTIKRAYNIISSSLDYAVNHNLILKNVAKTATLPKADKQEMQVWNEEEVTHFLKVAKEDPNYILFSLALQTGMRQGEILGLRWKDIDIENKTLTIKQVLSHDGKELLSGAKTNAGNRAISLSDSIISDLKKHRSKILQEKLVQGKYYIDNDLVNCTSLGTPLNPSNVRRTFNRLIKKADISQIRFHDLRHTHATLLLSKGVHVKVISERLGHSNIKITLETYSHVLPTMQQEAANKLNELFSM